MIMVIKTMIIIIITIIIIIVIIIIIIIIMRLIENFFITNVVFTNYAILWKSFYSHCSIEKH